MGKGLDLDGGRADRRLDMGDGGGQIERGAQDAQNK
jgi:hypothetical protein